MSRRFRAPKGNGELLVVPAFAEVGELARRNRELLDTSEVMIGGTPLREFRQSAIREILLFFPARIQESAPSLFFTGHQPELFHPGVWAKNFALNGIARRLNAIPLNLIVDNDTMKSAHITAPVWDADPAKVRLEKQPFDDFAGEVPWELATVQNPGVWSQFWQRHFGHPMGTDPYRNSISSTFETIRIMTETEWNCRNHEFNVIGLSQTTAFRRFAAHIAANLSRFRTAYNRAVAEYRTAYGIRGKSHPVPDLAEGELPFWEITATGRVRATPATPPERLRPRALTLTLFVRLCLADWFIHGIGGAKYDEVTDAIIRDFFGIEPPAFQVVTGTLHLPSPLFPSMPGDVAAMESKLRRLQWNPETFLPNDHPARLEKWRLAAEKPNGRPAVRRWFARIRELNAEMRIAVTELVADTERQLANARVEVAANAILQRRDFAWVLYPQDVLRPFLQQFL